MEQEGRNIVILFDGTGNEPGENKTNVIKIAELLKKPEQNKKPEQIIFYDTGVGTLNNIGTLLRSLRYKIGQVVGKAFGYGLKKNILDGYKFLMQHYKPQDRLYIFGFSRGAFTARKFTDLVAKYGVLNKGNENLFPQLLKAYFSKQPPDDFWLNLSHPCIPYFIGVWDTVASMGYFSGKKFFNNKLNKKIKFACHAISIDEKRKHFPVRLWSESNLSDKQKVFQVYFPGVHSDVGGWYKEDGLSDITLKWMLQNAKHAGLSLRKDWEEKIQPEPNGTLHNSKTFFWLWAELLDFRKWNKSARRVIPKKSKVHQSVEDRLNYNPENLDIEQAQFGEHIFRDSNAE